MEHSKLEYYLSKPRFHRFLKATGNSSVRAQKLYRINLRVSQAFYPVLNLFEIFLRNSVYEEVTKYFSNPYWILTETTGFMSDPTLAPSRYFLRNSIQKAEKTIKRKRNTVTAGKVVAEQSLGFWTSLFDRHHYRLIGGSPIQAFSQKPAHVNRRIINSKLNSVRTFRNRVYHNEPICFRGSEVDFTEATKMMNELYDLLNWIDSELTDYVKYYDNVQSKIMAIQSLYD